ncbi:MAG: hypothetical protein QW303_00855 [Nitrososphaerota archaeon]
MIRHNLNRACSKTTTDFRNQINKPLQRYVDGKYGSKTCRKVDVGHRSKSSKTRVSREKLSVNKKYPVANDELERINKILGESKSDKNNLEFTSDEKEETNPIKLGVADGTKVSSEILLENIDENTNKLVDLSIAKGDKEPKVVQNVGTEDPVELLKKKVLEMEDYLAVLSVKMDKLKENQMVVMKMINRMIHSMGSDQKNIIKWLYRKS